MISKPEFEDLCHAQANIDEILASLKVSERELNSWCHVTYSLSAIDSIGELQNAGKAQLKKLQAMQAKRSPTAAIWLSQQYLGQSEDQKIGLGVTLKSGRTPPYSAEEMKLLVDEYISTCERKRKTLTLNGLAYFLGYSSEQLKNWPDVVTHVSDEKPEYVINTHAAVIEYAITRIAMQAEEKAVTEGLRYLEKLQPKVWKQPDEVKVSNTITWGEYDKDL